MVVNFTCELDRITAIWLNSISECVCVLDDTGVCIGGLSKSLPSQQGWASSNLLKARMERKEEGRIRPLLTDCEAAIGAPGFQAFGLKMDYTLAFLGHQLAESRLWDCLPSIIARANSL